MAVYLDECQAGCNATVTGFPRVMLCMGMAVVSQIDAYLHGFHLDSPACGAE